MELREVYGHRINHKAVQKPPQAWDLPLLQTVRPSKPSGFRRVITVAGGRVNLVANRGAIRAFEVAYTDFTELVNASGRRKGYLIPILDHASKMVVGWAGGDRAVTELALQAWKRAKRTPTEQGAESKGLIVHHDQDPVFTGCGWVGQLLMEDRARVPYSLNGARGNTEMESFNSRFMSALAGGTRETENRSLLLDVHTPQDLECLVAERMRSCSSERRHSTIGYRAPAAYIATQWQRT